MAESDTAGNNNLLTIKDCRSPFVTFILVIVYNSLEVAAKDEMRLRPATEWSTNADAVYKILRDTFGEKLTKAPSRSPRKTSPMPR